MQTKSKIKKEKKVKPKKEAEYSEELVREVKEARNDYKNGRYFKGTADEVIKHLRDEANRIKKVQ